MYCMQQMHAVLHGDSRSRLLQIVFMMVCNAAKAVILEFRLYRTWQSSVLLCLKRTTKGYLILPDSSVICIILIYSCY